MTQTDEWLAANATVSCVPYRIKMASGKCVEYQDRNPDACIGCIEFRGEGHRSRGKPHYVKRFYQEVVMEGIKDLFVKPSPKREITKVQASVTTEIKDRIVSVATDTGYSIEKVCEAFILEGLKAYEAEVTKK